MVQAGKAVRPLQPKSQSQSPSAAEPAGDQKSTKRRCVSTACIPCRKRKSKCDGSMPVCSTCVAVYKTECSYDADIDTRRKTTSKRDSSSLHETNDAAAYILSCLRSCTDAEATDLLLQIRNEDNLDAIAESLRKNISIPQKSDSQGLEGDYSYLAGKELTNTTGQTKHYGHTSNLGLVATGDEFNPSIKTVAQVSGIEGWTSVTKDVAFIEHLLKLYFTWQHPFYVLFKETNFRNDFKAGRTTYCSSLLVNSICAYACHYSDLPAARKDPEDPKTVGDHFFAEARKLLFENESSCLTTCQALHIMSIREASAAREDSGFMYAGRSVRMAIELGLQLPVVEEWRQHLTDPEVGVRESTFWGLFTCDTAWSVCIGRISQLPRSAIGLDKPPDVNQVQPWTPYTDEDFTQKIPREQYEGDEAQFLLRLSTLSELVNDTVYMFYAPRDRLTSRRLLDRYHKYQAWHKALPACLDFNNEKAPPHFYHLHMYYWTCILHLFRPFLKYKFQSSTTMPITVCKDAAKQIRSIMDRYREKFTLRCGNLLVTNLILSSCTVHLLDLPPKGKAPSEKTQWNREAEVSISKSLRDLSGIAMNHNFAARCVRIICTLAEKWGVHIPQEVLHSITPTPGHNAMISPTSSSFYAPAITATSGAAEGSPAASLEPNQDQGSKTMNLAMHDNARFNRQRDGYSSEQTGSYTPSVPLQDGTMGAPYPPYATSAMSGAYTQSMTRITPSNNTPLTKPSPTTLLAGTSAMQTSQSASIPPAVSREDVFWTPFPGQGIPLIGNVAVDHPMDISSILGDMSQVEQFNRDGFIPIESWKNDALMTSQHHDSGDAPMNMGATAFETLQVVASDVAHTGAGTAAGRAEGYTPPWWPRQ